MSQFLIVQTNFTNWKALQRALVNMGFSLDKQVFSITPKNLKGYLNDTRQDKAQLILPKCFVGRSSNDLGFLKGKNGKIKAIVSEFDQKNNYGKEWLNKLKMHYNAHAVQMKYSEQGWQCKKSFAANGEIVMEISK